MSNSGKKPEPLTEIQKQTITDNMGIAYKATFRHYKSKYSKYTFSEILSSANMGLIHAVTHYKKKDTDSTDIRWYTYAMRCCEGFILDDIRKDHLIHIPPKLLNNKLLTKLEENYYNNNNKVKKNKKKVGAPKDNMQWFNVKKALNIQGINGTDIHSKII